jgi:hypothetical protein
MDRGIFCQHYFLFQTNPLQYFWCVCFILWIAVQGSEPLLCSVCSLSPAKNRTLCYRDRIGLCLQAKRKVSYHLLTCVNFRVLLRDPSGVSVNLVTLVAGLLAKGQYPVGPATGHVGAGLLGFPVSVYKRMLLWFPRLPSCYCMLLMQLHPTSPPSQVLINPLNTKRRLLYLKTQFVPLSKHFSSRL